MKAKKTFLGTLATVLALLWGGWGVWARDVWTMAESPGAASDTIAALQTFRAVLAADVAEEPGDSSAGNHRAIPLDSLGTEGRDTSAQVREYEVSLWQKDSLSAADRRILSSAGTAAGLDLRKIGVKQTALTDTLLPAEAYRAVVYDSLPEPTQPPYVNIGRPIRFTLGNGLKVIVYPDSTMPVVTFYLGILNQNVFEKQKKGVSDLTASMLLAGAATRTKAQIVDSLANMGSVFRMTRSSFYVSGLSRYALANFNLFADVVLLPSFPYGEFSAEQKTMRDAYELGNAKGDVILNRVYRALAFGKKIPAGEFISDASLKNVTLDDCVNYYRTYWRPNNAVLLVMGDITADRVRTMVNSRFRTWKSAPIPKDTLSVVNDLAATAVDFVHDPSARDARIIISNIAEFDYNSPDVFPAMFINYRMGGDLLANIRATLGAEPYTGDVFSLSPDPQSGYMYLLTRVPNQDVVRVIAEKTAQLQRIRTQPLDPKELADLKSRLIGRIALSFEDSKAMGGYGVAMEAGVVKKDFLEDILKQINAVTAEDVMRVAQKYIKPAQFRIVIYGDARKVVPPLELAGYEVMFYDKYAAKMIRPSLSQPVSDSVTARKVLERYFAATGGIGKMRGVKTLRQEFDVLIGERKLKAEVLSMLPYYQQQNIFYDGQVYLKKTYNGNMGYTKVENTTVPLPAAQVEKIRSVRSIFPLLDYQKKEFEAELDSIVPVRGHFTYRLRVTLPSSEKQNYYFSTDDYRVMRIENVASPVVKETDEKGNVTKYVPEKIGSYSDFDDYKEVKGVWYPFSTEVKDESGKILWKTTSVSPNVSIPAKVFR